MVREGLSVLSLLGLLGMAAGGPKSPISPGSDAAPPAQTADALEGAGSGGWIDSIVVRPYLPTDHDDVAVSVCGYIFGAIYGVKASSSVSGDTVQIYVMVTSDPSFPYLQYWCANAPVGQLAAGGYVVSVDLFVNGGPSTSHQQTSLTVATARFCWDDDGAITSNAVSDSFPSAVVFNDRLYLFWNKTYQGSVVYASYDGASWTGDVTIASCGTRSAVGAAVLGGQLLVFYSKPLPNQTSHLYYRSSFDGTNWSVEQELTTGAVYDTYGATGTVHNGRVYVLWKRWQNDGYRYIYSMTYDGATWGPATQLWQDGYIDTPVSAVSFQGKLYLFYGAGPLYRVLEGGTWSDEQRASSVSPYAGSEGASPASLVVDDRLVLLLVSDWSLLYQADFDGTSWSESRVTENRAADNSLLNLGAVLYHGDLRLFWGGIYADPTLELHSMVFTDADGDAVADRCDVCPSVYDPDQSDLDSDGHGEACDCDDVDASTYPGAPETNDGHDNQCADDPGYGIIDEISGVTGFPDPLDRAGFCWPPQAGATAYEARRAACSTMCSPCESFVTAGVCWHDAVFPPPGGGLFYLVRPLAPHTGSWGHTSSGVDRTVCP